MISAGEGSDSDSEEEEEDGFESQLVRSISLHPRVRRGGSAPELHAMSAPEMVGTPMTNSGAPSGGTYRLSRRELWEGFLASGYYNYQKGEMTGTDRHSSQKGQRKQEGGPREPRRSKKTHEGGKWRKHSSSLPGKSSHSRGRSEKARGPNDKLRRSKSERHRAGFSPREKTRDHSGAFENGEP